MSNLIQFLPPQTRPGSHSVESSQTQSRDANIRRLLTEGIRHSGKSREQVADDMSQVLGQEITARMLYAYTAESKAGHRLPLIFVPAFCQVVGDDQLEIMLLGTRRRQLLAFADAVVAMLDRAKDIERELAILRELRRVQPLRKRLLQDGGCR